MKILISTLFSIFLFFTGSYAQGDPEFVSIASGLDVPTAVRNADDGSNRLFICERRGRILIYDLNAKTLLPTPFLDITSEVEISNGEEGLLGLAFDPDYSNNGHFYVNYIRPKGFGSPDSTRIARYTVTTSPNIADNNSELEILSFEQPFDNHNGGDMHFGSDGFLYISTGDGGAANDPGNRSQSLTSFHGKMLRLDVSGDQFPADPRKNYIIPASNPFVSNTAAFDEIYHFGLRNPWRFSFDRLNGDMYIGDVGQNAWEEVSYTPAGTSPVNFGWKCLEGTNTFSSTTVCNNGVTSGAFTDPIFEYSHAQGQSITGGYVYRGSTFSNFTGWYFCIDFITNRLFMLTPSGGAFTSSNQGNNNNIGGVSSFGESESGELYAVSYTSGELFKLIDATVCPNILNLSATSTMNQGAVSEINSSAITPGNSNISYYAEDCIALLPGFTVPSTTTFLTILEICGAP